MKRSIIVLFLVLLGAAVSFASPFSNPFAGKWDAVLTSGDRTLMQFTATDNTILQTLYTDGISVTSKLGDYTYDDNTITINGQLWLYSILDDTHILAVGIIKDGDSIEPAYVVMRKTTEDIKSIQKPAFKQ
jgi:hypothetical protein